MAILVNFSPLAYAATYDTDIDFQGVVTSNLPHITRSDASINRSQAVPYVNGNDPYALSTAWTMMCDNSGVNWAQTGFIVDSSSSSYGTGIYYVFQVSNNGAHVTKFSNGTSMPYGSAGTSVGPSYHVWHEYSVSESNGYFDGTLDDTDFNGSFKLPAGSWIPNKIETMEEIHDWQYAQYWGQPTDSTAFQNPEWYDTSGTLHYPSLSQVSDTSGSGSGGFGWAGSSAFSLWDTRPN